MAVFPAPGFLLVELLTSETTADGIYRGDEDKKAPPQAKVLAIGLPKKDGDTKIEIPDFLHNGKTPPSTELQKGDTIYFIRGGDRPIDKKQSFVPFEHVLGLVEEDKK